MLLLPKLTFTSTWVTNPIRAGRPNVGVLTQITLGGFFYRQTPWGDWGYYPWALQIAAVSRLGGVSAQITFYN